MLTLADAATRAALTARIQALAPNAAARWGRMQAPEMLAHCRDSMRMAYGELYCAPKRVSLARLGVSKWLVLRVLPFPKGAPTAPELVARRPDPWDVERDALVGLIARFDLERARGTWPAHPLFGNLTYEQWGQLGWKHLDHHLRQFGV